MSWRTRVARWVIKSTLGNPDQWLVDWFGGGEADADGVRVGAASAQESAVNQAAINARAQDIAKLPLVLYRRRPDGGRERAIDHPVYQLVRRPRPFLTSYVWREMVQANRDLHGNGYTRIVRDGRMRPVELIPLSSGDVTPMMASDGTPFYDVRMYGRGNTERLSYDDMLHIKGRSDDGYCGKSPISRSREVIAADLQSARHGRRLYNNGGRPAGLLIPKGFQIGKSGRELAEKEFDERYGSEKQYRIGVAGQEFDYKTIGMTNLDAEWVNSRKLARDENASLWRMPPHKVGIMDHSTNNNIEHQGLEYVSDTLQSIAKSWEEELNLKLLREDEQEEYYFELLFDALLRGDFLSRMQGYAQAIQWGIMNPNEAREKENWNKREGGDAYLQPLNMWPSDKPRPEETAAEEQPDEAEAPPTAKLLQIPMGKT